MNTSMKNEISKISSLNELYEFICENDEAVTEALSGDYKFPV